VRLLVATACVAAIATAPALASPRRLSCVLHPDAIATAAPGRSARTEPVQPHTRVTVPDVHRVRLDARPPRAMIVASRTHDHADRELPWIWRVLRERALSHLPHHDDTRFSLALTPVVVASPSDSIPGLGVSGSF
jgi:hypothetical protein